MSFSISLFSKPQTTECPYPVTRQHGPPLSPATPQSHHPSVTLVGWPTTPSPSVTLMGWPTTPNPSPIKPSRTSCHRFTWRMTVQTDPGMLWTQRWVRRERTLPPAPGVAPQGPHVASLPLSLTSPPTISRGCWNSSVKKQPQQHQTAALRLMSLKSYTGDQRFPPGCLSTCRMSTMSLMILMTPRARVPPLETTAL